MSNTKHAYSCCRDLARPIDDGMLPSSWLCSRLLRFDHVAHVSNRSNSASRRYVQHMERLQVADRTRDGAREAVGVCCKYLQHWQLIEHCGNRSSQEVMLDRKLL